MYTAGMKVKLSNRNHSPVGTIEYVGLNSMIAVKWKGFNAITYWTNRTPFVIIDADEFNAWQMEKPKPQIKQLSLF
jgi:hypothetical protein